MRINLNKDLLSPLVKYIANPLLTTVQFHEDLNEFFPGLGVQSPDHNGVYIARTKSFNSFKPTRLNKETPINICSYCKSLYLLDSHRMNFVFFVPSDLEYITKDIIDSWHTSLATICTFHFIRHSKRYTKFQDVIPNLYQ